MGNLVTVDGSASGTTVSITPPMRQFLSATSEADLTDEQFAVVAAFADESRPIMPAATPDQIGDIILALASTLKAANTDEDQGKMKFALYRRALADVPHTALQTAANIALRTLEWMPTPAELLKLATGRDSEIQRAHDRAVWMRRERAQRMMRETMDKLAAKEIPEADLGGLNDRLAQIAMTRGHILALPDGTRLYRTPESIERADEMRKAGMGMG